MVTIEGGVEYETASGGSLRLLNDATLDITGLRPDGFAFWKNVEIDAEVPMSIDVSDEYKIEATVQHITGEDIISFGITSLEPNGKANFRITGLKPEDWYRLHFDGIIAETNSGRAHGQTTKSGVLQFNGVHVPD